MKYEAPRENDNLVWCKYDIGLRGAWWMGKGEIPHLQNNGAKWI